MSYTFYEIVWMFFIYSFLGWCTEEIYATWAYKKFVNRGFFYGALCPIYGFGMLLVISCLEPLRDRILVLFIGSVVLTSLIELVTGFVLEKIFNEKWWDYTNNKFNLHGYICLSFSILWGIGCAFVVYVIHPVVISFIDSIPLTLGIVIISIIMAVFILDLIVTSVSIFKIKKNLRLMDDLARRIKAVSDEIGKNIYDSVSTALNTEECIKENVGEFKEKMSYAKEVSVEKITKVKDASVGKLQYAKAIPTRGISAFQKRKQQSNLISEKNMKKIKELEELKKKYKKHFDRKSFSYKRIVNAFPILKDGKYKEYLSRMKSIYKK